jgi:hypothetical protein
MKDRDYVGIFDDSEELSNKLEAIASTSVVTAESVYILFEAADHIRCMYDDLCLLSRLLERGRGR